MKLLSFIGVALALVLTTTSCTTEEDPRATLDDAATATMNTLDTGNALGPSIVLDRMLAHARAGDWSGYVSFYGESAKFSSAEDRDALVSRFEERWGAEVLTALERADAVTPVLDGNRAVFRDGAEDAFILYRSENGHWGFHL